MGLSKTQIQHLQSLKLKKFRQLHRQFVVEGDKMARELLLERPDWVEGIFAREGWLAQHAGLIRPFQRLLTPISEKELERISTLKTPNQVLLLVKQNFPDTDFIPVKKGLALYLDSIQDPGNLGTILRTADWFGISAVFLSPGCVERTNPKTIQASMSSLWRVPTEEEVDLPSLRKRLGPTPWIGARMEGDSLWENPFPEKAVLVIGSEGTGISEANKSGIDQWFAIPAHPDSRAESLNAAVAAGIFCAHYSKGSR